MYGDGSDEGNNAAEFIDITQDGGYILFNDSDTPFISDKEPNNFGFMKIKINDSLVKNTTLGQPEKFNKKNADKTSPDYDKIIISSGTNIRPHAGFHGGKSM